MASVHRLCSALNPLYAGKAGIIGLTTRCRWKSLLVYVEGADTPQRRKLLKEIKATVGTTPVIVQRAKAVEGREPPPYRIGTITQPPQ